ncbi:MAG TPA: SHOCT domain-containing protein [Polyangia bacterium]|jgi:putative membrane protein|nr:SHOCT domain-containing protein [Polyangia bacterium]
MYYWSFWGMNFFWWIFWVVLMVAFFSLLAPVPRGRMRLYDNPLSVLQRRYAGGEISTQDYEERKTVLERDIAAPQDRSFFGKHRLDQRHAG